MLKKLMNIAKNYILLPLLIFIFCILQTLPKILMNYDLVLRKRLEMNIEFFKWMIAIGIFVYLMRKAYTYFTKIDMKIFAYILIGISTCACLYGALIMFIMYAFSSYEEEVVTIDNVQYVAVERQMMDDISIYYYSYINEYVRGSANKGFASYLDGKYKYDAETQDWVMKQEPDTFHMYDDESR